MLLPNLFLSNVLLVCPFKFSCQRSVPGHELLSNQIAQQKSREKEVHNSDDGHIMTIRVKCIMLCTLILQNNHYKDVTSTLSCFDHNMTGYFVWSNRLHTISKNVLIQPVELGGLKMISTKCIVESAKVMWIKRFCNSVEAKWKTLALNLMGIEKNMLNRKQL